MKKPSEPFVLILLCLVAVVVICIAGLSYEYGLFSSRSSSIATSSASSFQHSSRSSGSNFVNVNTASVEQLEQIPGMNYETASKIVTYRETNGSFSTLSQLAEIPQLDQDVLVEVLPFLSCE